MKKATLALLTVAAAASMAGIAHAVPFGAANNVPPGLENNGGAPPGLGDQSGSPSGLNGPGALSPGLSGLGGNNPFATSTYTVSAVPEGGSGVILLGAGLFALALFGRRFQRSY
jgi:hypothetical protein